MTRSPASMPSNASSTPGSKTIVASGAPSFPCFGADARSVSGEETQPIGLNS